MRPGGQGWHFAVLAQVHDIIVLLLSQFGQEVADAELH